MKKQELWWTPTWGVYLNFVFGYFLRRRVRGARVRRVRSVVGSGIEVICALPW